DVRLDESRRGFKGGRIDLSPLEKVDEAGEAARAVAAHFSLAAIRIVVAHAVVAPVLGGLHDEQAIGPDAALALAESGDLGAVEGEGQITVVENDEIVPRAVHFPKTKHGSMA